jgi:hypothetical protein
MRWGSVSDVIHGFDAERAAALRADGRFFWLDVSSAETDGEDLVDVLGISDGALRVLRNPVDTRRRGGSTPTVRRSPSPSAATSVPSGWAK